MVRLESLTYEVRNLYVSLARLTSPTNQCGIAELHAATL